MHEATVTPLRERPTRAQIEPAALGLLARHSAALLATARRYSLTPEDAEDAYQRGVEILLTKAPTTSEDDLLPWLKTVVKHEAFAVRKQRGKALPVAGSPDDEPAGEAWADERAERYERLRVGAEAMARLKPQEIRCLLLKAEGYSYKQICDETGWTYTKVNRCLTEGRRSFMSRVAGIESGEECRRLEPLISKLADGEASPSDMQVLRPHIKGCLACRATLRDYRAAPARAAALVPPVAILATPSGFLARIGDRFHALTEMLGAQKAAAVAASAAALAGGGVGVNAAIDHKPPPAPVVASGERSAKPDPKPHRVVPPRATPTAARASNRQSAKTDPSPAPAPRVAPAPTAPPAEEHARAPEFQSAPASWEQPQARSQPTPGEFSP